MTRRGKLLRTLEQSDWAEGVPEAIERLEAAEVACEHVRRYIMIRRGHDTVAPSWVDLEMILDYVCVIPGALDATPNPAPAEDDEVTA